MSAYLNVDGTNPLGFTCAVCGRKTQGTTIVNGMKFCAKCYQETFVNSKITDLKHQLTEKEFKKLVAMKPEEIDFSKLDKVTVVELYKEYYKASQYWFKNYQDLGNATFAKLERIKSIIDEQ